jgi:capsular exopolysaccharide synthesis family protein
MARRVAVVSRIADDEDFFRAREFSILGRFRRERKPGGERESDAGDARAKRESIAGDIIFNERIVTPVTATWMCDVSFVDPNPERARKIATAYGEAFAAATLERDAEADAFIKAFLDDRANQLKLRLTDAQKALQDFADKERFVDTGDRTSLAERDLAEANTALGRLISERVKNEEQWKQVQSTTAISSPQFLTSKIVDGIRNQRNELVSQYQEKSETFGPTYPAMVQLSNKIKEIDRQLAAEAITIKEALKAAYESSLSQENEMRKRVETLTATVLDIQTRTIHYNTLRYEVDTTRKLHDEIVQRLREADIRAAENGSKVVILEKAKLPSSPSSPIMSRMLTPALVLGILAALAVTFVLEHLDDAVHSPEEMERISGLATLGVVPRIEPPRSVEAERADPRSAVAEAYRSLCTALQFSTETGLPKTLLVTSAIAGEGKSNSALAIARYFAAMGLKVLIIDADLRAGRLHELLGVENSVGLSNYLTGGCSAQEATRETDAVNLVCMSSGPPPPNPADLLGRSRMLSLLSVGLETYDLIVIDGPPVLGMADAISLSKTAAATVFVIAGQTRKTAVRNALRRLKVVRAPVVGAVITKFDAKTASHDYAYGSDYAYAHAHDRDMEANSGHDLDDDSESARPQLSNTPDAG